MSPFGYLYIVIELSVSMFSGEEEFTKVAKLLDQSVLEITDQLLANNIEIVDNSLRSSLEGKGDYPFWAFSFVKSWPVELETAKVTVRVSYYSPASRFETPAIHIDKHFEIYRQAQESRVSKNEKFEYSLEYYRSSVKNIILGNINKGVEEIEKAL